MDKELKIFLIAGEPSGDNLGAKLIHSLIKLSPLPINFKGVGGPNMTSQGLQSIFPMSDLSVMGFLEILPHIPKLLSRINQTAQAIEHFMPDIIITIDSPDFCFRVIKKIQHLNIKRVHYVAPTVWAYRPKRAAKIAKLYRHLLLLLPFEPPYFEKEGLACTYIGHPIVEDTDTKGNGIGFRNQYMIPQDAPLLCVMPGSRRGEVERLLPIFVQVINKLQQKIPDLNVTIITLPHLAERIKEIIGMNKSKIIIVTTEENKKDAMDAANFALVKSGTSTLEVALAKLPMVVTYKINPITAFFLRRLLRVPYVTIINLIIGREVIPELLQDKCTPELLAAELLKLHQDKNARERQLNDTHKALLKLGYSYTPKPSEKAAIAILELMKNL